MKPAIKRNLLRAATAAALVCTAALVFLPTTVAAAPATATATVNVRAGASTSFPVVDTLRPGESVDVLGCRTGWCFINHSGPSGYVSSAYLRRGTGGTSFEPNFNLNFNFPNGSVSIGTGGVSVGVGPDRPSRPPRPAPGGSLPGDVCFYSGGNY